MELWLFFKFDFSFYILNNFAGPVVSLLLRYLSHREIIIGGTFIGVIGYIISIWMPNVEALIVTYGLLAGKTTLKTPLQRENVQIIVTYGILAV